MWRIIFGFLWEGIVGKDQREKDPNRSKLHKIRVVVFLISAGSIFYGFMATQRLMIYYDAFNELQIKYAKLKEENNELKRVNRELEDAIINGLNKTKRPSKK